MTPLQDQLDQTADLSNRSMGAFRAAAPTDQLHSQLGALTELPGTWVGRGFNLIALPNFANGNSPLPFRLKLSQTRETLNFIPIGGPIPNRGQNQPDIFFVGVHYFQQVSDAVTLAGMHLEPGMWLNLPPTLADGNDPSLVRLATIPHGDSLLAQGALINGGNPFEATVENPSAGRPIIDEIDPLPFTLDASNNRVNDPNPGYIAPYTNPDLSNLGAEITPAVVLNPNRLLTDLIANQKILATTVLRVDANPIANINGPLPGPTPPLPLGGITNIPFVNANAKATTMSAIFWIEKVQDSTGNIFMQLQYTQTVILDFIGIKWPHISVATLVKQ
jgi:hypothetical protein